MPTLFALVKRYVAKNGLDNNSQTIINVTDPVNATDAATKNYVDTGNTAQTTTISTAQTTANTAVTNAAAASAAVVSETTRATTAEALLVPKTTTVNGLALSANITLTAANVGLGLVNNTADSTKTVLAAATATLASTVTTNANLTGDVTSVGNATTLTNAPVIAKVLTGFVSGAGTVTATDSILTAIQKLNGNDSTTATAASTAQTTANTAVTNAATANTAVATEQTRALAAEALLVPKTTTVNGLALSGNISLTAANVAAVATTSLGVANGVATLDATGKIPLTQITATIAGAMVYQGVWNASTNVPALASGVGTKGYFFKVSTAGTTLIDTLSQWNVGDLIIFDGTTWDKIDGIATEVTSVAGRVGAVVLTSADVGLGNVNNTADSTKAVLSAATATLAATVTTNANLTGMVTSVGNTTTVVTNANLTGDVTSAGNATTLTASGVTAGIYTKVTVDTKGRVTLGATLLTGDVPVLNQNTTGNAATVTTNANLTGMVTSVGNTATVVTNANLIGDVTSVGNTTTLTNAPVIAKVLTGFVSGAGTISATDSILTAFQKINGNDIATSTTANTALTNANTALTNSGTANTGLTAEISRATAAEALLVPKTTTVNGLALSGNISLTATSVGLGLVNNTADSTKSVALAANVTTNANLTGMVTSVGNATTVVTNANLTGDVTSVGNTTTLTNAPVIAKVLTGYVSGAGVVAATDTILVAFQKLNGNDNAIITTVTTAQTTANTAVTNAATANTAVATEQARATAAEATLTTNVAAVTVTANAAAPKTGTGASGTWPISITGTAAGVTTNANLTGGVTSVGNAATVVTNANLTGMVTSVGNATTVVTNANLTGDVTSTGNATILAASGVTAGTYNNVATSVAPITVDGKGRITAVGAAVTIAPAFASVTGKPTTLVGYGITDSISSSLIGAVNGIASLDATGKIPLAQITASIAGALQYQGVWNATTNIPAIVSGAGNKGYYYKVSVGGATAIDGISQWNIGDLIVFDGTTWDKIDGIATEVTTVAGRVGAVVLTAADVGLGLVNNTADSTKSVALAANVTTNANLTGMVTSVGNTATVVTNANLTGDVTSVGNATTMATTAVTGKALTGFVSGAGVITAADTILSAINKLNGNDAIIPNLSGGVTSVGTVTTVVTNANLTGMVTSVGNTTTVVTNANLTGEVTSVGNAATLLNSAVIGKVLTGYVSGAGVVAATDTILGAINKLNGNITAEVSARTASEATITTSIATAQTTANTAVTNAAAAQATANSAVTAGGNNLPLTYGGITSIALTTTTTTANQIVDQFAATAFTTIKYLIQASSAGAYHAMEVLVMHDGSQPYITEVADMYTTVPLVAISADVATGVFQLLATPTNAVTVIKVIRTAIVP